MGYHFIFRIFWCLVAECAKDAKNGSSRGQPFFNIGGGYFYLMAQLFYYILQLIWMEWSSGKSQFINPAKR